MPGLFVAVFKKVFIPYPIIFTVPIPFTLFDRIWESSVVIIKGQQIGTFTEKGVTNKGVKVIGYGVIMIEITVRIKRLSTGALSLTLRCNNIRFMVVLDFNAFIFWFRPRHAGIPRHFQFVSRGGGDSDAVRNAHNSYQKFCPISIILSIKPPCFAPFSP